MNLGLPVAADEHPPPEAVTSSPQEPELAFLPARAWAPALACEEKLRDDDEDPVDGALRFALDVAPHGAVGDTVATPDQPGRHRTFESSGPESGLLANEVKQLEQARREKRRDLLARTVYVRGLPASMPQAELAAMLLDCGPYNRVRICGNAPEGQNYIYGFVEFASAAGAERMMQKSGTELPNGPDRAPLRLDCTRVKRPIMDKVADDADPERGTPCTFGLPTAADTAGTRTLGDVLHVVPPTVQAKSALRKGIERCACGCDGESCCACCRCFTKAGTKGGGHDAEGKTASSAPSCCGGCSGEEAGGVNSSAGPCCGSSTAVAACSVTDPSALLSDIKEELEACTQLLCAMANDDRLPAHVASAWIALCERVSLDHKAPWMQAWLASVNDKVTGKPADAELVMYDVVRLQLFVGLITGALLLSHRRAATALPLFSSLKDALQAVLSKARTVEHCEYASSIACFAAMSMEPADVELALAYYELAQAAQSRGETATSAAEPPSSTGQNTSRTCVQALVDNLTGVGGGGYVPPERNPSLATLFHHHSRFFNGRPTEVSRSFGDSTAVPG